MAEIEEDGDEYNIIWENKRKIIVQEKERG
jgi:hypothetical protein